MSGAKKPSLRTFLALWPDAAVRAQLAERSAAAARACAGRAPQPDTLHLTLVFIGTTSADRIAALSAMMDAIDAPWFALRFDRSGWFRQSGVAWLGVREPPEALMALQEALARGASRLGFSLDVRPYVPHLTLARDVHKPLPDRVFAPLDWPVASFVLVASDLLPAGPRYRILHERRLGATEPIATESDVAGSNVKVPS